MDSGSADFWVAAEQCQEIQQAAAGAGQARSLLRRKGGAGQGAGAAAGCGKHQTLGTTTSSSFVDSQQPFQVTYGSGAVAGTIIQDNVVMAGLQLNKHVFGTANEETVQFTGAPFDGLMGLAQSVSFSVRYRDVLDSQRNIAFCRVFRSRKLPHQLKLWHRTVSLTTPLPAISSQDSQTRRMTDR